MPSFARELEQTLHNALTAASSRHHEYATLEHLLLALIGDEQAAKVMGACGVRSRRAEGRGDDLSRQRAGCAEDRRQYRSLATSGFQRVVQRAILHVQSSGREK